LKENKILSQKREQELLDRLLGYIGEYFSGRELYDILHNTLEMTHEEMEGLGFDLQSYYGFETMIEGLTAYAIERQVGFENHRYHGERQPEERNKWIRDILRNIANNPQNAKENVARFDRRLEQMHSAFAMEPASLELQRETISGLCRHITELESAQSDPREQIAPVRELLEDMAAHLPWCTGDNQLDAARDWVNGTLTRITVRQPIRFTRVVLGGEWGPFESGFVSGTVKDAAGIMATDLYRDVAAQYPERKEWPSLCTVYTCGPGYLYRDASPLDLEIMNRAGDEFLKLQGVQHAGGPYQQTLKEGPTMTMKFR